MTLEGQFEIRTSQRKYWEERRKTITEIDRLIGIVNSCENETYQRELISGKDKKDAENKIIDIYFHSIDKDIKKYILDKSEDKTKVKISKEEWKNENPVINSLLRISIGCGIILGGYGIYKLAEYIVNN